MLKCAGLFRLHMARRNFTQTYSSPADYVQLQKSHGMEVNDEQKAEHYLEGIGYCRLSAYMHPVLKAPKTQHQYKRGTSFKKVMMLISLWQEVENALVQ